MNTSGKFEWTFTVVKHIRIRAFERKHRNGWFSFGYWLLIWLFRKVDCFRMGWPMRPDADFFVPAQTSNVVWDSSCFSLTLFWIFTCLGIGSLALSKSVLLSSICFVFFVLCCLFLGHLMSSMYSLRGMRASHRHGEIRDRDVFNSPVSLRRMFRGMAHLMLLS